MERDKKINSERKRERENNKERKIEGVTKTFQIKRKLERIRS